MTLTKNKMIREIGRRTRLKNREVQLMLEALIEVWTEELVSGGKIELENFLVLEVQTIDRGKQRGLLGSVEAPRYIQRVSLRVSKRMKTKLQGVSSDFKDSKERGTLVLGGRRGWTSITLGAISKSTTQAKMTNDR